MADRGERLQHHANIGVLTALPKEYAAFRLMLDEPLPWSAPGTGAGRRFTLGVIQSDHGGFHVIAVTVLPDTGNNIAAISAIRLLDSFPRIRHIIMCGIAGGVPRPGDPEHDVRLGDIVVSNRNGVVQYDLVKEKPDGSLEHRFPPRPPGAELLEAVQHLQADELLFNRPWETHLEMGRSMKNGVRPADTVNSKGHQIDYPPDPDRQPGKPRVFHGTIAAANRLLKNPAHRDYLADTFDVRAIEMESSGIADAAWVSGHAGYLAVRGICDYCDENKGDLWQGAAAVAAAAYVRALVGSIHAESVVPVSPPESVHGYLDSAPGRQTQASPLKDFEVGTDPDIESLPNGAVEGSYQAHQEDERSPPPPLPDPQKDGGAPPEVQHQASILGGGPGGGEEEIRVFISYSHDSNAHRQQVLNLAQRLRSDGLDCRIDQFVNGSPPEGWPLWIQRQVRDSDFVFVVCTETYRCRFDGEEQPGKGKGIDWEGILVIQQLYDARSLNAKFIPVLLEGAGEDDIPLPLQPYTRYQLPAEYDVLYRYLTGQPKVIPAQIGPRRQMEASTPSGLETGDTGPSSGRQIMAAVWAGVDSVHAIGNERNPSKLGWMQYARKTPDGRFEHSSITIDNELSYPVVRLTQPDEAYYYPQSGTGDPYQLLTTCPYLLAKADPSSRGLIYIRISAGPSHELRYLVYRHSIKAPYKHLSHEYSVPMPPVEKYWDYQGNWCWTVLMPVRDDYEKYWENEYKGVTGIHLSQRIAIGDVIGLQQPPMS